MKLLFDQNLSHKLVARLSVDFVGSAHVRDFSLARGDDALVWECAKTRDFGNCSTKRIEEVLRSHTSQFLAIEKDPHATFLIIG